MKLRKFLTLFVLATGAFFALSNKNVKADGEFCLSTGTWCRDDCVTAYIANPNSAEFARCWNSCDANQYACYDANAWQNWLLEVNLNIGDNFLILNEPSPYCAYYPDMLVGCGSLPTAEEIEACVMMIQAEQAKFNCPH